MLSYYRIILEIGIEGSDAPLNKAKELAQHLVDNYPEVRKCGIYSYQANEIHGANANQPTSKPIPTSMPYTPSIDIKNQHRIVNAS